MQLLNIIKMINPFVPSAPFLYTLKASENPKAFKDLTVF